MEGAAGAELVEEPEELSESESLEATEGLMPKGLVSRSEMRARRARSVVFTEAGTAV